ncbi:L-asparaginase 1-like isoform X2 [Siphateles boraxobius]|uniref:L-asparaginase 1-like isoform X2 n=2 Tax=Siphateles boraxobius TaxID=180520 RepID=UPI004062C7E4
MSWSWLTSCFKDTATQTPNHNQPTQNGSGQPTGNHADNKPKTSFVFKLQKSVSLSTAGHSSPNVKDSKVLVINTGGTIGMMEHENGLAPEPNVFVETLRKLSILHDEQYAQQKTLDNDMLVLPLSKQKKRIEYRVLEYSPLLDSCNMGKDDWTRIAKDIEENYDQYNGFVVLHGTDTMAYTTSALSFMCENLGKPVIFTGSQVPIFETRNDGRENLLGALLIAGELVIPEVCLYFHHKLYRGNCVTKVDSGSFKAFDSPNLLPLAIAEVDITVNWDIVVRANPTAKFTVNTQWNSNVGLLRLFPGITADTVMDFLKPMEGIVLETYGSGNAPDKRANAPDEPPTLMDVIHEANKRGLLMINCTQCLRGTVTKTYATGQALDKADVVAGCDMTAEAALSKLSYVLAKQDLSTEEKRKMLMRNLRGEMTSDLADSCCVQVIAKNLSISRKKVQELQFDVTSQSHTIEKPFTITWSQA